MNGILVIDKSPGWTSQDVVTRVRRMVKAKKAGHGGTLDPLATGVLPVYLEEATKLVPFNLEGTKEYVGKMRLGQETDTLDADGKIIAETPYSSLVREDVEGCLERFRGVIRQIPPLYSAIKHEGVPLYKRARAGETPPLRERETTIHSLLLKEFSLPFLTLEISCSRGTYIRSLCRDIGRVLGCGAHLVELRRLRSGQFSIDQALDLARLSRLVEEERIAERIIPLSNGVDMAARFWLENKIAARVRQGRPLHLQDLSPNDFGCLKKGQRVGLLHGPGHLLAIAESQVDGEFGLPNNPTILRILRVFNGG
ncbi:MAG: tRNA pseudouridine(55) synthase TruB [Deltaproteobacteria bacterium]|nr:tRNA pseudouridine(55) synthase TruB [Deltaproteobacteria bacterium]